MAREREGCSEASASVLSEGCTASSILREYRTIGYHTVYWDNGEVSQGGPRISPAASADRAC